MECEMSDPAVEAAQRAASSNCYTGRGLIEAAAREALKPIRELHYPREGSVSAMYPDPLCNCGDDWPCDTAPLIYATEELNRDR